MALLLGSVATAEVVMRYLFGFLMALAVFAFAACGGDECADPVADVTGEWKIDATPITDTCGGSLAPYTFFITATQEGNALTSETPEGTMTGTICGDQIRMSLRSTESGGTATVDMELTVSLDGNSAEGSDTWRRTSGAQSCGGSESLSATRIDAAVCGDNVVEPPEQCDGVDLQGLDCTDFDFTGGTLACTPECMFDTSGCTGPVCGDNIAEGTEVCDGTDLAGLTCADFGFTGGTLACLPDCSGFDTSSCTAPRDLCINDADRTVYESLEYIDEGGTRFTCIDAATAIAADCPIVGCLEETGAVFECYPNCAPDVIAALDQCVADCTEGATGLSSECAGCYGGWVGCGARFCLPDCSGGKWSSPSCTDCLFGAGCTGRFDACSGLPGDIDCGTGGTGGNGGTGGTGGAGGA